MSQLPLRTILAAIILFGSLGVAEKSDETCVWCNDHRWPRACCDVGTQFCCDQKTCCTNGQICADGNCIDFTPVPPVPPGPHTPGELLWMQPLGGTPQPTLVFPAPSSSSSHSGPIVVASAANISAFDLITGAPKWTSPLVTYGAATNLLAFKRPRSHPPTTTTTPLAQANDDDASSSKDTPEYDVITYIGYNATVNIIASIKVSDGSVNWQYALPSYLYCSQQYYLSDDVLFVATNSTLMGLSALSGQPLWSIPNPQAMWCGIAKGNFVVMNANYNVNATASSLSVIVPKSGRFAWQQENVNTTFSFIPMYYIADTTIVTLFFDGQGGGKVTAYDIETGHVAWTFTMTSTAEYPVVFANTLYLFEAGLAYQHLIAVDCTTGKSVWRWAITLADPGVVVRLAYHASTARHKKKTTADVIALVQNNYTLYGIQGGTVIFNVSTLGELNAIVNPQHVNGQVLVSSVTAAWTYLVAAVHETTGEVIWQYSPTLSGVGITTATVDGEPLSVAAVVAEDTFLYGVAAV